jgi:ribosome maturation factor RimP
VEPKHKIKVVLDSDKTVAISDCIAINRAIEQKLDRDEQDFSLEVTSAGLGQPLKLLRQYSKYIGKELEVTIDSGVKLSGELRNVTTNFIELREKNKEKKSKGDVDNSLLLKLDMNNIKKAIAIITI